jgi:transglutaminase-like putative cysteine protease
LSTDYHFSYYDNKEPYYSNFCDKIDIYDTDVQRAAAQAIQNDPGSYSIAQLLDIYDWVKENIVYQTSPLAGIPYHPSETLGTGFGDCKNQAVLIASMIGVVGGTAKVVADPTCTHAYTIVYFGSIENGIDSFTQAVADHYESHVQVNYFTIGDGVWVIFDPAGGFYPGDTLPECYGERTLYYITTCMSCANQYPSSPFTFEGKCYSQCPSGTVHTNNYACSYCDEGEYAYNNECVTCPSGYYLATDGMCYPD